MRSAAARTLLSFSVPGGALLMVMAALLHWGVLPLGIPLLADFFRYTVLVAGLLMAARFASSQAFFVILLLGLANAGLLHAMAEATSEVGRNLVGVLLPVNFALLAFGRVTGFKASVTVSRATALFVQSVFVVAICRPEQGLKLRMLESTLFPGALLSWTRLPQPILAVIAMALVMLAVKYVLHGRALDAALFWALASAGLGLRSKNPAWLVSAYFATGGLILIVALVESSYRMAFHDELTGLPSRRAFNHALQGLSEHYAVAMVDVDHFKQFNDTFGHDSGDHVLRMVASRLARVTGGGQVFRCGGEEFAVLFPGKSSREAYEHAEALRHAIAHSAFTVRGPDRSQRARPERRRGTVSRRTGHGGPKQVGVTVSIGLAEPHGQMGVEKVIRAADKALYSAKENGRNRVELAAFAPPAKAKATPRMPAD